MLNKLHTFGKGLVYTLAGLALLIIEASLGLYIGVIFLKLKEGGDVFVWVAMIASLGAAFIIGLLFSKLWNKAIYEFAWLYRVVDRIEAYIEKVGENKVFVVEAIVLLIALAVIVNFYPRNHYDLPAPQASFESYTVQVQKIQAPVVTTDSGVKIYGLGFMCSHQYNGLCEGVTFKTSPISTAVAVRASEFSEGALFTGLFTYNDEYVAFVTDQNQILVLDKDGKLVTKVDINVTEGEISELFELNVVDTENFSIGYKLASGRNFMIVCDQSTLTITLYLRMQ